LEPSPGKGPAVSSGTADVHAEAGVEDVGMGLTTAAPAVVVPPSDPGVFVAAAFPALLPPSSQPMTAATAAAPKKAPIERRAFRRVIKVSRSN
jgi:hypothetical protein